jgi:hypothetical protein
MPIQVFSQSKTKPGYSHPAKAVRIRSVGAGDEQQEADCAEQQPEHEEAHDLGCGRVNLTVPDREVTNTSCDHSPFDYSL